jgi:hypothetical protein
MSQENVEVVRRAFEYEIYGRGHRAEAEEIFDPNFVMNPAEEGPSYGLDAVRENFEHWRGAWGELEVTAGRSPGPTSREAACAAGIGLAAGDQLHPHRDLDPLPAADRARVCARA